MTTRNEPAMPCGVMQDGMNCGEFPVFQGMTKREVFVLFAMNGLSQNPALSGKEVLATAVWLADETMNRMEEK